MARCLRARSQTPLELYARSLAPADDVAFRQVGVSENHRIPANGTSFDGFALIPISLEPRNLVKRFILFPSSSSLISPQSQISPNPCYIYLCCVYLLDWGSKEGPGRDPPFTAPCPWPSITYSYGKGRTDIFGTRQKQPSEREQHGGLHSLHFVWLKTTKTADAPFERSRCSPDTC